MNNNTKLAELRHSLARYGLPPDRPPMALGHAGADAVLGGGLRPVALHEVVLATGWSAGGFAALLTIRAAKNSFGGKGGPLFWVPRLRSPGIWRGVAVWPGRAGR